MPKEYFLELLAGNIFWRFDSPVYGKGDLKPKSKPRPDILFLHTGVADHTMWDDQVAYLTTQNWGVLRMDLLGYGKSIPSEDYLADKIEIRHQELVYEVFKAYHELADQSKKGDEICRKVIIVGLGLGAEIAIDFALDFPKLVSGLFLCTGGLSRLNTFSPSKEKLEEVRVSKADYVPSEQITGVIPKTSHVLLDLQLRVHHWKGSADSGNLD